METPANPYMEPLVLAFLNFLRGMETGHRLLPQAPPQAFLNFLRGMETQWPVGPPQATTGLPKLP